MGMKIGGGSLFKGGGSKVPSFKPSTPKPDVKPSTPKPDTKPSTPSSAKPDVKPSTPKPDTKPSTPSTSKPDSKPQFSPRPDINGNTPGGKPGAPSAKPEFSPRPDIYGNTPGLNRPGFDPSNFAPNMPNNPLSNGLGGRLGGAVDAFGGVAQGVAGLAGAGLDVASTAAMLAPQMMGPMGMAPQMMPPMMDPMAAAGFGGAPMMDPYAAAGGLPPELASAGAGGPSGLGGLLDTVANAVSTVTQMAEAVTGLMNQVGGGAANVVPSLLNAALPQQQDTQQTSVF
jgi:hypothetical protein